MNAIRSLLLGFILSSTLYASVDGSKGPDVAQEEASFQITAEEFCSFLNNTAVIDPLAIYEGASHSITRSGEPGNYSYTIAERAENEPPSFLNKLDRKRYFTWKNVSQKRSLQEIETPSVNSSSAIEALLEEGNIEFDREEFLEESANDSTFNLLTAPDEKTLSIDPLLRSNNIGTRVLSSGFITAVNAAEEETAWDHLKEVTEAFLAIGTLVREQSISLQEPPKAILHEPCLTPINTSVESRCYSHEAILESLKAHTPAARFQAEQELLAKQQRTNPLIEEVAHLEKTVEEVSHKTSLGYLNEVKDHLLQGTWHFINHVFYQLSPLLDVIRRFMTTGFIGYQLGAFTLNPSAYTFLTSGTMGIYATKDLIADNKTSSPLLSSNELHQIILEPHHGAIKESFLAAGTSLWRGWFLQETKRAAQQARHTFYQTQLENYYNHVEDSFSPEQARLLLEAKAHEIINASAEKKMRLFYEFTEMGKDLFGPEIMHYVLPPEDSQKTIEEFSTEKDRILANIRAAYVSIEHQWQEDNLQEQLKKIDGNLNELAQKVAAAPEGTKHQSLHQFITQAQDFYGPTIMETILSKQDRTQPQEKVAGLLHKLKFVQVPLTEWSPPLKDLPTELERMEHLLLIRANKVISEQSPIKKEKEFERLKLELENFCGPKSIDHILGDANNRLSLSFFRTKKEEIIAKAKVVYASMARQHQKLLDSSKKTPLTLETFLALSPGTRFNFLVNHAEELQNQSAYQVKQLGDEERSSFLRDIINTSASLAVEAGKVGIKTAVMTSLGFITGAFIGHEMTSFCVSQTPLLNLWSSSTIEQFSGAAYSVSFLCAGLQNHNIIHTSIQQTASTWTRLHTIWNRSSRHTKAREELAILSKLYSRLTEKHTFETTQAGLQQISLSQPIQHLLSTFTKLKGRSPSEDSTSSRSTALGDPSFPSAGSSPGSASSLRTDVGALPSSNSFDSSPARTEDDFSPTRLPGTDSYEDLGNISHMGSRSESPSQQLPFPSMEPEPANSSPRSYIRLSSGDQSAFSTQSEGSLCIVNPVAKGSSRAITPFTEEALREHDRLQSSHVSHAPTASCAPQKLDQSASSPSALLSSLTEILLQKNKPTDQQQLLKEYQKEISTEALPRHSWTEEEEEHYLAETKFLAKALGITPLKFQREFLNLLEKEFPGVRKFLKVLKELLHSPSLPEKEA